MEAPARTNRTSQAQGRKAHGGTADRARAQAGLTVWVCLLWEVWSTIVMTLLGGQGLRLLCSGRAGPTEDALELGGWVGVPSGPWPLCHWTMGLRLQKASSGAMENVLEETLEVPLQVEPKWSCGWIVFMTGLFREFCKTVHIRQHEFIHMSPVAVVCSQSSACIASIYFKNVLMSRHF